MAEGFGRVSHGDVNGEYYGRDKECLQALDSEGIAETLTITTKWQAISSDEKLGNREKGIRGRHDARVGTNMILSMPNEYTPAQCLEAVKKIIDQTPAKDCYWSAWVHKGVKNGITNQHIHLSINERIISTGKKDRVMQKKGWFHEVFMKLYQKELEKPLKIAPKRAVRDRIPMGLVQSDPIFFQNAIKALNEPKLERYFTKLFENGNFCIYDRKLVEEREGEPFFPPIFKVLENGSYGKNPNYEIDPKAYDLIPREIRLKMNQFSANKKAKIESEQKLQPEPKPKPKPPEIIDDFGKPRRGPRR